MTDLTEVLREAAKRGITHLSLHPVDSEDRKKTYWRATATPSTAHKYVMATSEDPVEALTQVLQAMPKAPKRSAPKTRDTGLTGSAETEITAAVIEPPRVGEIDDWMLRP